MAIFSSLRIAFEKLGGVSFGFSQRRGDDVDGADQNVNEMIHRAELEHAGNHVKHILPIAAVRRRFGQICFHVIVAERIADDAETEINDAETETKRFGGVARAFDPDVERRRAGNQMNDVVRQRQMRAEQIIKNEARETEQKKQRTHDRRYRISHIFLFFPHDAAQKRRRAI